MISPATLGALRKIQDNAIIESAMKNNADVERVLSHTSMQELAELLLSPDEKQAINSNPDIDFPVILTETHRQKLKTNLVFIDPQQAGQPMKAGDWLFFWFPFQYLNLEKEGEHASKLIGRALSVASNYYDIQGLQFLIDRLWRHRWIFDVFKCAQWRLTVLAENEEELQSIISEGKEAKRAFDELESRLCHIKDDVQTLDEWIEELYLLGPFVKYNLLLHRYMKSDDEDVKQWERFIDEISADIYALLQYTMTLGVFFGNDKIWTSTYLPKNKVPSEQIRATKREMSYRYRARVFYPKFWFDEAIAFLTNDHAEPPERLNAYDHQHFLSCFFSYAPDNAYRTFKGMYTPTEEK